MKIFSARRAKNEYGSTFAFTGVVKPDSTGRCDHVSIQGGACGARRVDLTLSITEAAKLRDFLTEILETP